MSQKFCVIASWGRMILFVLLAVCGASSGMSQVPSPMIVQDDRGGYVGQRAMEIATLNAQQTMVELRGRICYSSCTMYLGANRLCISPATTFGFHGPSQNGRTLPTALFDHWSNVMAAHYNEPLRDWFMREGRYRISGYFKISGGQLIEMGYRPCQERS